MKKRFPRNLLQSVLLFALGCILATPVLFLSDFFKKTPENTEVVITGFSAIILVWAILIAFLKNKLSGLKVAFNSRLIINQGLIAVFGTLISFLLINVPFFKVLTKYSGFHHTNSINSGIVFYLGVIFIGPILEELFFRGIILSGLLEKYTPRKAILLTSAFFALIHGEPFQIVFAFFWGLLFGYTFYKTRSIILVILLHMTVNFSSFLNSWVRPANEPFTFFNAYGQYSWLVYGIAVVGLATGCFLLFKRQMLEKYLAEYQQLL